MLSACSSSPANKGAESTTTTAPATTPTTANGTTSSTTPTTASSTNCQPSQLSLSAKLSNGAAGQIEQTVSMKNTSSTACTMAGYPGMQLYDSSGMAIPTNVVRGQQNFAVPAANQPPATVTLSPGGSADFIVHYEDVTVGTETSCPTSASAHVTPPNDFDYATVAIEIAPCNGGTVHVSPVFSS